MEPMRPDRWLRLDRLLEEALQRPPAERRTWLERECRDDPTLLKHVLTLLAAESDAERLIGEWVGEYAEDLIPLPRDERSAADTFAPGTLVGPYRILDEIGRGGMGAVYAAERADGEFTRRVALKVVKRGMDSDEILRRFRHERRILASLEHPHIARLYDGGMTDDGRPYLVMELVDGLPITQWCDENRVGLDARLSMFLTVCEAVQHAHSKLIVHRDIKPSNILVSANGTPRLLDFGIAKLLDDDAEGLTRTGARLLTPEYAAPEQLRGEAVTTAADVYGLGALLHELLAGVRSRRSSALDDATAPPPLPSAAVAATREAASIAAARRTSADRLHRQLRGELDTIVVTALRARPEQRYASVPDLIEDVRRYRAGIPIRAAPASRWDRTRKFVQRNRAPVALAAVACVTLVAGAVGIAVQARSVARQRDVAESQRARAEQVTEFLVRLFDTADPTAMGEGRGDTLRIRTVLDRGADRIRSELAGAPTVQGELLATLARIYTNLGVYAPAEALVQDALAATSALDRKESRAERLGLLARITGDRGEFARADSLYAAAVASLGVTSAVPDSLRAALLGERGLILSYLGSHDAALDMIAAALALTDSTRSGPLRSRLLNNLALVRYDLGEYALAESLFRRVYDAERSFQRADHPALAATLNNIASSLQYQGQFADAEPIYVQAIDVARRGLGAEHSAVGDYLQNLATLYDDQQRHADAEPIYRQAVRIYEKDFGRGSPRTAMLLRNLAVNRFDAGDYDEAAALLREVEANLRNELGPDHMYAIVARSALGRVLTARGERTEAFDLLTGALSRLQQQLPAGHYLLELTRRDIGVWHATGRDFETAEPLLLESLDALTAARGANSHVAEETRAHLRNMYEAWGRPEHAMRLLAGQSQ